MRSLVTCSAVAILALCVAAGLSLGDDDPKEQPHYVADDVQYFPAAPEFAPAVAAKPTANGDAAFGARLFTGVSSVRFVGPSTPANSDGSFGGTTVGGDENTTITIYERFIVREVVGPDKTVYRTAFAYTTIGEFDQRINP